MPEQNLADDRGFVWDAVSTDPVIQAGALQMRLNVRGTLSPEIPGLPSNVVQLQKLNEDTIALGRS